MRIEKSVIIGLIVLVCAGCNSTHVRRPDDIYECVECGMYHRVEDSYYCEDGMSACSEECYVKVTGERRFDRCENCKKDVRNVLDENDGYLCPHCGFKR